MSDVRQTVTTSTDGRSVNRAVVSAAAEATGRDVTELEPLFRVVDPDALGDLFAPQSEGRGDAPIGITFEYVGCRITVERGDDGAVSVTVVRQVGN